MQKIYSIYLFTFPNNKKYCGYTSQKVEHRWDNGNGYIKCPLVYRAILKYGWDNVKKEVIFTTTNQEEAYQKEKEIIKNLQLQNPNFGYNLDEGGCPHGGSSYLTEEGRKKISETHKRLWATQEYREKMLEKIHSHPCNLTEEARLQGVKKSAEVRKGKPAHNAKLVLQLDKNSLEVIKEYPSATAASIALGHGADGCSNILNVCKGRRQTAYGYKWRFKES